MPEFQCKVGTPTGEIVERIYSATDEGALRSELGGKDLLVLSVRRRGGLSLPGILGRRRGKVSAADFLVFNQELAALVQAGLPILECLDLLIERRKNPVFKQTLVDVKDQVRSGVSLSDAFASHGDLFPSIYSSSLASGERSGEIVNVLQRYIKYMKTMLGLRKKVVSAIVYPAVLAALSGILIGILIFYILPKFSEFFEGMETDLPMLTVVLVGTSLFLRDHVLFVLGFAIVGWVGFTAWKRTATGRMQLDQVRLSLPLIGKVWQKYAISGFCRTLGTLLSGGIPLVPSLEIATNSVGIHLYTERLKVVSERVREGRSLYESLEQTGLLTDMSIGMIRVGEQTGALEGMLFNISDFYDEEIDNDLQTIISLLEPLMLIFMGVVIAVILLSIYLPLFKSYSAAQG
jgi:type IV pilus assembly protein PilC